MFWISPAEALDRYEAGQLEMLPPTAFTLAELCAYPNVAAVLEAARRRDTAPVMSKIMVSGGKAHFLIVGHTPDTAP